MQNFNEAITGMVRLAEKVPGAVLLTWMSERRENKRRVERQKTHRVCVHSKGLVYGFKVNRIN